MDNGIMADPTRSTLEAYRLVKISVDRLELSQKELNHLVEQGYVIVGMFPIQAGGVVVMQHRDPVVAVEMVETDKPAKKKA